MNKNLNYLSSIYFLMGFMKGVRKNFVMFYLGWLFDSLLSLSVPVLFGIMIDEIVYYQNIETFILIAVVFLVCCTFSCGLYFFIYVQHGYLMNMFVFSIRKTIYEHLQKCDAECLTNVKTGEVLALLQNYSEECLHFLVRNVIHTINGVLLIILYGSYLMIIDWRIGLVALVSAPLSVLINTKYKYKIRMLGDKEREKYGEYIGWMYEVITALRDIRMLGAKGRAERMFKEKQKTVFQINFRTGISMISAENVISLSNLVIQMVLYTLIAYLAIQGRITVGLLTIIIGFYNKLADKIKEISNRYLDSQNRISFIQKIFDFLHFPKEKEGRRNLKIYSGSIRFCNVDFSYKNGKPVLQNFSLEIQPGERTAIVGKSGCGKTTMAGLLMGFYYPQRGRVIVDGQDLQSCSRKSICQSIGMVQQDVLVFDGTIRENLLMGNPHASGEQIEKACREAGLLDFMDLLPEGLDTVIGSRGIDLSGGQKQRIAIARIYLRNPQIIIFDEATSALDSETEETIHQAWKGILSKKTSIIIAHRQSSVMLCDRVAIIEEGKLVETGTPKEMEQNSRYFQTLFAIKGEDG